MSEKKREILFRGKTKHGQWVHGWFCGKTLNHMMDDTEECSQIIHSDTLYWHVVEPQTVGQFTGLTDKNGKKIFEGDIVKLSFEGTSREYAGDFSEYSYEVDFFGHKIGVVTFGGYGTFLKVSHGELFIDGEKVAYWEPARKCRLAAYRSEVIGNIHDNPELLKEASNV